MSSRRISSCFKTTAITVLWEVEDIWNLNYEGAASPYFYLSEHTLCLCARGYESSIGIYLCRDDKTFEVLRVFCKISLIDHHGQERFLGEKEIVAEKAKDQIIVESLMIADLQRDESELLRDDILTISCVVSSSYKINLMRKEEGESIKPILRFEALSSNLEQLYNSNLCCDAVLKTEDGEFPVHRAILSARSSKLADIFNPVVSDGTAHIQKEIIPISGMKASTLRNLLYYIYTGKIQGLTTDNVADMYAAAKEFCLQELKISCQKVLQTKLATENIFDIADLAYTHNDQLLKQYVDRFIVENVDTVIKSPEWKEFSNQKSVFANEILTSVLLQIQKRS